MIPPVVASDRGGAQTVAVATRARGSRTTMWHADDERKALESAPIAGERPVREARCGLVAS